MPFELTHGLFRPILAAMAIAALNPFTHAEQEGFTEERRIGGVRKLSFWPKDELLIGQDRTAVLMLDTTTSEVKWRAERANAKAMDPNGKYLAGIEKSKVVLRDGETGKVIRTIEPSEKYNNSPTDMAISPDGSILAIAVGSDWKVHLHQLPGGKPLGILRVSSFAANVAFSPDSRLLAISDETAGIQVYHAKSQRHFKLIKRDPTDTNGAMRKPVFSPDSRMLAVDRPGAGGGEIWLWDLSSGRVARKFEARVGREGMIAFSPDGRWVAASGIWKLRPDNRYAAVRVWETRTGKEVATLTDLDYGNHAEGLPFAFSPDGKRLAIGFEHLRTGPALVIWRWGPGDGERVGLGEGKPASKAPSNAPLNQATEAHTKFTMTVVASTNRGRNAGTDNVRVAIRINGDPAHQAILDNPGANDFSPGAADTFENLQFDYPISEIKSVRLSVVSGDDAWNPSGISLQIFQGNLQTRRYYFAINQWLSADRTDVKGTAKQHLDFFFDPKPVLSLEK